MIGRNEALFEGLCDLGNRLEEIRDTVYPQGSLWLRLDSVLQILDAVVGGLVERPPGGDAPAWRRRAGRQEDRP